MYCSNCGNPCASSDRFCPECGNPLVPPQKPKQGSRFIPILIMVALCSFCISLFFSMPYGNSSSDMPWFRVDDGMLYFDADNYHGESQLHVPSMIDGVAVTALSEGCFEDCDFLVGVTLPESLEAIGAGAFRGCSSLRGVEVPESVLLIGKEAFYDCSALEAVSISSHVEVIGADAFDLCDQLHYIMFSGSYQDWCELYDEFINPYTTVFCSDGSFYQGSPAS